MNNCLEIELKLNAFFESFNKNKINDTDNFVLNFGCSNLCLVLQLCVFTSHLKAV